MKTTKNKKIGGITNNLKAVLPSICERCTKEEFQQTIERHFGVVTGICNEIDCTYSQFYRAIEKWNLKEFLAQQKQNLVNVAEKALLECLDSEDEQIKLRAAEFCLKCQGKQQGWSYDQQFNLQQQITVGDKEAEIKQLFNLS